MFCCVCGVDESVLDIGWGDHRQLTSVRDNSIDVVVYGHTAASLHDAEDECRVFNTIMRVTKPGGRILIMSQALGKPLGVKLLISSVNR
jgi:ubiquinone/menaquinone biosynthesis C-methylase UbiE